MYLKYTILTYFFSKSLVFVDTLIRTEFIYFTNRHKLYQLFKKTQSLLLLMYQFEEKKHIFHPKCFTNLYLLYVQKMPV